MNRQTKTSLEPSLIPKRTQKQQILCDAIEDNYNYQSLESTVRAKVSRVIKQFGNKFDLSCEHDSVQTIVTEIIQDTVETALNKSEEFDLNRSPFPWILAIAMYKVKGWQRDKTRSSDRVISLSKFSSSKNNLSEEEALGLLYKSSQSFNTEDLMMLEYLLSLVIESDRKILKLAFIDDLNGKDLAAALGVSEGTAYTKKHRALMRFKKAYTQTNQDCQEGR